MYRRKMEGQCVCHALHSTLRLSDNNGHVGIFLFVPSIPNYPNAKFPGVVVFSEIYQGKADASPELYPYQTLPVGRFNFSLDHSEGMSMHLTVYSDWACCTFCSTNSRTRLHRGCSE